MMHGSEALPDEVSVRVEQHLTTCDACQRLAQSFDEAERGSEADVERRVFARVNRHAGWTPGRALGLAAGVLLACGLAAFWLVRSGARPAEHASSNAPPSGTAATSTPGAAAPSVYVSLWTITPPPVRIPLSSLEATRGPDAVAAERGRALLAALEPYQSGDYRAATSRLEAFVRQYPAAADGFLYLGVSYLMAERPAEAIATLERAAALKPEAERREADWYRAAAEQRSGRLSDARARLSALCQRPGAYQANACAAEATLK
jgi:tetratricopeptide (TPR) repeat protein